VDGFLDMVVFDIWDGPNIPGIFAERIARILSGFRALKIFLPGVFLGDPDCVQVEHVFV
jgi:hypothetical protein